MRMISYAVSGAATALGFASYLPIQFKYVIAASLIITLSTIYLFGLKLASEIETVLVIINILGLVTFIVFSLTFGKFSISHLKPLAPHGVSGIFAGISSLLRLFRF